MSYAYKKEKKFTCEDYISWDDDERWELINGIAFLMSPAPAPEHQRVSIIISNEIFNFLKGKKCEVYHAPFDVMLFADASTDLKSIDTVLQPDIFVTCDPSKIDSRGLRGAPDLIIEILSPYTAERDFKDKYFLYQQAGVREYWIIDPASRSVHSFSIDPDSKEANKFQPAKILFKEDILVSSAIEGLTIELNKVFE